MFSFLKRPPVPRKEVVEAIAPIVGEARALSYFSGLKRGFITNVPMMYDCFVVRDHRWEYDQGIRAGTRMRNTPDRITELFRSDIVVIQARTVSESGASHEQVLAILDQEAEQDAAPNP